MVLYVRRWQNVFEFDVPRRVAGYQASPHGKAKDAPDVVVDPPRYVHRSPLFDALNDADQVCRRNAGDRSVADHREGVHLKPPDYLFLRGVSQRRRNFGEPLAPDDFESVSCKARPRRPSGLPTLARVGTFGQQLACFVALLPRARERHIRVGAKREQLFLAVEAVPEAPPLTPRRGNDQEQAASVKQLGGLRGRLGIAYCDISQRHEVTPMR